MSLSEVIFCAVPGTVIYVRDRRLAYYLFVVSLPFLTAFCVELPRSRVYVISVVFSQRMLGEEF